MDVSLLNSFSGNASKLRQMAVTKIISKSCDSLLWWHSEEDVNNVKCSEYEGRHY